MLSILYLWDLACISLSEGRDKISSLKSNFLIPTSNWLRNEFMAYIDKLLHTDKLLTLQIPCGGRWFDSIWLMVRQLKQDPWSIYICTGIHGSLSWPLAVTRVWASAVSHVLGLWWIYCGTCALSFLLKYNCSIEIVTNNCFIIIILTLKNWLYLETIHTYIHTLVLMIINTFNFNFVSLL